MCTAGVARGGGFQEMGAYVNLGAYYIVGIPVGLLFGFHLKLNAKGLWMGTLSGSVLNVIILSIVTALTDWQKEVCFLIQISKPFPNCALFSFQPHLFFATIEATFACD